MSKEQYILASDEYASVIPGALKRLETAPFSPLVLGDDLGGFLNRI